MGRPALPKQRAAEKALIGRALTRMGVTNHTAAMPDPARNMNTHVLAGVLARNHPEKTLRCLASLAQGSFRDVAVLFIDNGSGQGIGDAVRARFPQFEVTVLDRNVGAAGGRNLILDRFFAGQHRLLLFLDNDVTLREASLERAVARTAERLEEDARFGALGIALAYRDEPDKLWSRGGGCMDWPRAAFRSGRRDPAAEPEEPALRRVETIPTAFMLSTRDAAEAAGRFVEEYQIYLEDTDWCWQMVKAGYRLWADAAIRGTHDVSSSVGKCSPPFYYYRTRNRMWFFQAESPLPLRRTRRAILRHVFLGAFYPELRAGRFACCAAVARGYLHGLRLPPSLAKRKLKK